jgi:phage FluMu protein Com
MPIEFRCTQCGKLLRTADTTAGKQAKCPSCGAVVTIPQAGTSEPYADSLPTEPSGEAWNPPQQPAGGAEPQSWQAETNPYQPPAAGGISPIMGEPSAAALARVSGPAIGLMVTGGIGITWQMLLIAFNVLQVAVMPQQAGAQANQAIPAMLTGGIGIVFAAFSILIGTVIIYGAMQMKGLRSYSLAMTSAILAMVPCFSPCCLLGLPFGIWALVVISSADVKSEFRG